MASNAADQDLDERISLIQTLKSDLRFSTLSQSLDNMSSGNFSTRVEAGVALYNIFPEGIEEVKVGLVMYMDSDFQMGIYTEGQVIQTVEAVGGLDDYELMAKYLDQAMTAGGKALIPARELIKDRFDHFTELKDVEQVQPVFTWAAIKGDSPEIRKKGLYAITEIEDQERSLALFSDAIWGVGREIVYEVLDEKLDQYLEYCNTAEGQNILNAAASYGSREAAGKAFYAALRIKNREQKVDLLIKFRNNSLHDYVRNQAKIELHRLEPQ